MRVLFLLVSVVLYCTVGYCQQGGVNTADAARIDKVWRAFLDGLVRKDTALLHGISLSRVQCEPCMSTAGFRNSHYTSIDSFLKYEFDQLRKGTTYPMSADEYWVNTMVVNERPDNLTALNTGRKHYVVYELAFASLSPAGLLAGTEQPGHLFRFIDVNGNLLFFGLATLP
jgi:hypothetical protein